ncbi:MAG: hypothetical protein ACO2PN_12285 [Pyrobaculum sp.]|jgi:ribonuclease HII
MIAVLTPRRVRQILIDAALDKTPSHPCLWFHIIVNMGKNSKKLEEELKKMLEEMLKKQFPEIKDIEVIIAEETGNEAMIPECVVAEATKRIVLGLVNGNRSNWISLDNLKLLILRYAEKYKCKYEEADEKSVADHARIVAAYTREWVRLLADGHRTGSSQHMTLAQDVLYNYLSRIRYCS